jgi:hypothetical protein
MQYNAYRELCYGILKKFVWNFHGFDYTALISTAK